MVTAVVLVGALFGTTSTASAADPCPNAKVREQQGTSDLPDCRAYELVSPRDTGAIIIGPAESAGGRMTYGAPPVPLASSTDPLGVVFMSLGGALPGIDGFSRDSRYRSVRGAGGWTTRLLDPPVDLIPSLSSDVFPSAYNPHGFSADHAYSVLTARGATGGLLRHPDGSVSPFATGPLGATDNFCNRYIAPGGANIVFDALDCGTSVSNIAVQLAPGAPSNGPNAVYRRTPDGPTEVVSLLPGDVTPFEGSRYLGASTDGETIAFETPFRTNPNLRGGIYVRVGGQETYEVVNEDHECSAGSLDGVEGATVSYQWLRNGSEIGGATARSYPLTPADAGTVLQCQVTVTTANAGSTQASPAVRLDPRPSEPAPTPPGSIPAPEQSADLTVGGAGGQTLTCDSSGWVDTDSFAYRWFRNGEPIVAATASTYVVTAADVADPAVFQCGVTGSNASGGASVVSLHRATTPEPDPAAPGGNAGSVTATAERPVPTFGAVSASGDDVSYVSRGDIYQFDVSSQQRTRVTDVGDAELVNISDDASDVYFVSHAQVGGQGVAGEPNLYAWDRATDSTTFVATVDSSDLQGPQALTGWEVAMGPGLIGPDQGEQLRRGPGNLLSRVTPDGEFLLFGTRAQITSYDNAGRLQFYRYEAATGEVVCVSCDPQGDPATADASLQTVGGTLQAVYAVFEIANLSEDGQRVFFETSDRLVPDDAADTQDVYEWRAQGTGDCAQPAGCVALLSSGRGSDFGIPTNYLYAASPDGDDVFILTNEQLLDEDLTGGFGAIYDVRRDGGFAADGQGGPSAGCVGDECQAPAGRPPAAVVPGSTATLPGNPVAKPGCASLARRARQARQRARSLRRKAARVGGRRAGKLRKRSRAQARKGALLTKRANRCRGGSR